MRPFSTINVPVNPVSCVGCPLETTQPSSDLVEVSASILFFYFMFVLFCQAAAAAAVGWLFTPLQQSLSLGLPDATAGQHWLRAAV